MYNDREYTISYPMYPDEGVDYLPALTDAVAEYAESNTENNRAVVLELLKRSFVNGEKLITPYEIAKEKGKIVFLMKQVAEKKYILLYTSQEASLKAGWFRVMESPIADVFRNLFNPVEEYEAVDGIALNFTRKSPPCYISKGEIRTMLESCRQAIENVRLPQHQRMRFNPIRHRIR